MREMPQLLDQTAGEGRSEYHHLVNRLHHKRARCPVLVNNDFGSKVSTNNEDRSSRRSGGSVRPPPRNPYRPPRGAPPPSSPVRQSDNSRSDEYSTNSHSMRGGEPRRRPPPRNKGIPYPRGMIPNNPRSIDNSGGASTSQLIAFATRHQAQIQKQQTHYIRNHHQDHHARVVVALEIRALSRPYPKVHHM